MLKKIVYIYKDKQVNRSKRKFSSFEMGNKSWMAGDQNLGIIFAAP